jgi:Kef-type K+ transport system membrane component KefB
MPLLTSLLLVLVCSRVLGALLKKIGQPEIVGEMLAGILLGPSLLGLVHPVDELAGISELAAFLIVLSAGLEMRFADVINAFRGRTIVVSILGFVLPLGAGIAIGGFFELDLMRTLFLALCISITALPVTIQVLKTLNLLNTDIARYAVSTAIFNDVAALLALGVLVNMDHDVSLPSVMLSIGSATWKLGALASVIFLINWILKRLQRRGFDFQAGTQRLFRRAGSEAIFGAIALVVLVFGSFSETMGFHFVVGSFFGALMIEKRFFTDEHYSDFERTLNAVSSGFLNPVFFAFLGLQFYVGSVPSVPFVLIVIAASIITKVAAGYVGGRIAGMEQRSATILGFILNGRGVMELVIAGIAYQQHFIDQGLFSVLVLMGILTTMMTPLTVRWIQDRSSEAAPAH